MLHMIWRDVTYLFAPPPPISLGEKIHDVHEVATLLKMYFRELPEPVVPTAFYHPMLEASVKASRFCVVPSLMEGEWTGSMSRRVVV